MADQTPQPGMRAGVDYSLLNESHVAAYLETNGEKGGVWNGATAVLVTTNGRKSGEKRTIAIIGKQVGDNFVIIASKGGSPVHPLWYLNILADPNVEIQYLADKWEAVARTAELPEARGSCGPRPAANGRPSTITRPAPNAASRLW